MTSGLERQQTHSYYVNCSRVATQCMCHIGSGSGKGRKKCGCADDPHRGRHILRSARRNRAAVLHEIDNPTHWRPQATHRARAGWTGCLYTWRLLRLSLTDDSSEASANSEVQHQNRRTLLPPKPHMHHPRKSSHPTRCEMSEVFISLEMIRFQFLFPSHRPKTSC